MSEPALRIAGLSPEQQHRSGLVIVYGRSCYLHGPDCEGRAQAAHYIAAQTLREERRKLALSGSRFSADDRRHRLVGFALDRLVADWRNGLMLCVRCHDRFDGRRPSEPLEIPPPLHVVEFVRYFGLAHYLPEGERA